MIDAGDSLVAPSKSSPIKAIAAVVGIAAVGVGGWWMFGRGKGQAEDPARVLIVGPTPELEGFLTREGFDVTHLSVAEAIGEGQKFDGSLDEVAAMLEYADQSGIGFLALNMSHGETYDFESVGYSADAPPPSTTFAVLSVGDLGQKLAYGGVVPEVFHEKPAGEETGLLLALFEHEQLSAARDNNAVNDIMIRFGSAGTVEDVAEYEKGQENMRRQIAAWTNLASAEAGASAPIDLAKPYEPLRGWPLANGELLLASGREAWRSPDGRRTEYEGDDLQADLGVVSLDAPDQRKPCTELPDTLSLDEGFAVSPAGDALLIPSTRAIADLWVLDGEGCSFVKRDQIRRLSGGELGHPRASGRTAASQGGSLAWADAKMRRFRNLTIPGVRLHDGELHWVNDEVVAIPAEIDYLRAARTQQRRNAEFGEELPELDETAFKPTTEGLVLIKLPAPREEAVVQAAVIPVERFVSGAKDDEQMAIRAAFPLPAASGDGALLELMALVDREAGAQLTRVSVPVEGAIWQNVVAPEYDLQAAAWAGGEAVKGTLASDALPHLAHELSIAPDGGLAAWAAPVGEAPSDQPLSNFEIFTLVLGQDGAEPVQVTSNQRVDQRPRFVGPKALVINTGYTAAEKLPTVEAVRLLKL